MQKISYSIYSFLRYSQFQRPMTRLAIPTLIIPSQKFFDHYLIFVNLYQHAKNQFIPSVHSSDKVNFRVPSRDWPHPFSTMPTRKISNHILVCVNLYQHVPPKLDNCICSFLRYTVNLEFREQTGHTHILTMPNQKLFEQLSIFVHFYQNAKNEAVSSICSWEITD